MKLCSLQKLFGGAMALMLFVGTTSAQSNLLVNPSFEVNNYPTFPGYSSQVGNGPITGWSGSLNFGLNPAAGVSAFANNGSIPHGSQVAFLQNAGTSLSQTVSGLNVGQSYELRFHHNARVGFEMPVLRVTVAGSPVFHAPVGPVGGTNSYNLHVSSFTATSESAILKFEQMASGDATVLIDNIVVRAFPGNSFIPPFTTTDELTSVRATTNEIILTVKAPAGQKLQLIELAPYQSKSYAALGLNALEFTVSSNSQIALPRFDFGRDRIYSGFVGIKTNVLNTTNHVGEIKFVETMTGVSKHTEPFPMATSKKGLQVQMTGDAIALGTRHAAVNLNLPQMYDLNRTPGNPTWVMDGETYYFNEAYLNSLDLKRLSTNGIVLSLILIYIPGSNLPLDSFMVHPQFDSAGTLSALNTSNADGLRYLRAGMEFLADRFSRADRFYGRVVNYIVGNEVNAHWYWNNMGLASMETVAEDYLRAVRTCHTAVRKISAESRVYISLDHSWAVNHLNDSLKGFAARPFIDYFAARGKAGGDFDWHIAHHPYPQNLFEPRTWLDTTATTNVLTSPRVTFKNIEILPQYLSRNELLYRGTQRRVILSEQGFHADYNETSERRQAAAYCYAYFKTANLPGIDSFILHRHVDHAQEGGLNLGLWRRVTNSIANPATQKPIYDVFKQADTTNWQTAFQFALAEIGISNWNQLITWSAPTIVAQPTNRTAVVDGTISFSIAATGAPVPSVQWRFNGVDLTNGFGISGATNATLTLSNLSFAHAGLYSAFLRNGHGISISTNASLTVLSMFENWRRENFSAAELLDLTKSGPSADPDEDGLPNAVEFALNYNPRLFNTRALLEPKLINEAGQEFLTLNYRERLGTSGLTYTYESSTNLLLWSADDVATRVLSQEAVTRTMEARVPLLGRSNLFLRSLIHLEE